MKTLINFLETTEHRWMKMSFWDMGKYVNALKHIEEHTPKFIVEYGGGQSTFMLTEFVNYLDYGGKVIGYESDEYWYNDHIEKGWNKYNNVKLVNIEQVDWGVRYIHSIEEVQGVDFVILDGPDLTKFTPYPITTYNLKDIVDNLGKEVPYFIDGREGFRNFYSDLGYTTDIGDEKYETNS